MPGSPGTVAARPTLILASSSPRRLDLLARIGVIPDRVQPMEVDETPLKTELPRALAIRLAADKAMAGAALMPDSLVLAADTVVALGRRILGKPTDGAEAARFLGLLSGRRHRVMTAVCLAHPGGRRTARVVTTILAFQRLTQAQIEDHVASGEWHGVAGGYQIQKRAEMYVRFLSGSHSNVVGLPLFETTQLLRGAGWFRP